MVLCPNPHCLLDCSITRSAPDIPAVIQPLAINRVQQLFVQSIASVSHSRIDFKINPSEAIINMLETGVRENLWKWRKTLKQFLPHVCRLCEKNKRNNMIFLWSSIIYAMTKKMRCKMNNSIGSWADGGGIKASSTGGALVWMNERANELKELRKRTNWTANNVSGLI